MKLFEPGHRIDDYVVQACIHSGAMAHIYSVKMADGLPDPGFPMVMKVPRMTEGDSAENIIGFEIEQQIMPVLGGSHVPRYVGSGDVSKLPYIVMEHIDGQTLQSWLDRYPPGDRRIEEIARIGAHLAYALHGLHKQDVCHLDLKPANVMLRPNGKAVLLDFGLSCHAHYPDLLAEELRKAVGSPTWIAPEQVVGVRGDPRSDVFAMGVMLYEMCTAELPFGCPETAGGLRQRLWMQPTPPRQLRPGLPGWMQEVILRCLEPHAVDRYPSAAHVAFDLTHPAQVTVTTRGETVKGVGFWTHVRRWIRAAGMQYQPSPLPTQQIAQVPIVMVALPHEDVSPLAMQALQRATHRALGGRPGARLACLTVLKPGETSSTNEQSSETWMHRQCLSQMREWACALDLQGHQASYHVIESADVAQAILTYAEGNHVNLIVMGAATHGLAIQRFVATVPIKVAMHAPCTVMLVKA